MNRGLTKKKDCIQGFMEKFSFLVFAFLFAGILIHLSSATESLPCDVKAAKEAFTQFVESVESDLQKVNEIFKQKSLKTGRFPLVEFKELSACAESLKNHAQMLPSYRFPIIVFDNFRACEGALNYHMQMLPCYHCHDIEQIDLLESKIRYVFLEFMRFVSFWFMKDVEALLAIVNLNENISLRVFFESVQTLSSQSGVLSNNNFLSNILWEMSALPFGLIKANLDLGYYWNTTGTQKDILGNPIYKVDGCFDWFAVRSRLSSLRIFLNKARDIRFFPQVYDFLKHLETLIMSRLENFIFNGEDAYAFEKWYRECYSLFDRFLSYGYYPAKAIEVNEPEKSVIAVEDCLKSLKIEINPLKSSFTGLENFTEVEHLFESLGVKIENPFDFTKISSFFDNFEYASFRLSNVPDETKYHLNSVLKGFLVEFYKEILHPLYYDQQRTKLLTFLKESGNLKLIFSVLKLLNARGDHYDISIENDEVLPESIYFNAFQLIEHDIYFKRFYSKEIWDEFKKFVFYLADILEFLPKVFPKKNYAVPKMPLKNYIANLRYLVDNAEFNENSGIFDVNSLKNALSLIAENKKVSEYHNQVTLVIFYLIQYYERIAIDGNLKPSFLLALQNVRKSWLNNATYDNFYNDIGNITELLNAMEGATFTLTSKDYVEWKDEHELQLRNLQQNMDNQNQC
jgi:hypothetical protein